jgi:hypothetical protein
MSTGRPLDSLVEELAGFLFGHSDGRRSSRVLSTVAILALYLLGVRHWVSFFNYGHLGFNAIDWQKEYGYYSLLQQALAGGVVPYHAMGSSGVVFRFLGIPETVLSPQIVLLGHMTVGTFVMINTVLMYSLGFVGTLVLRNRYRMSFAAFSILVLLFNFNGHIVAHLGAGHSMWNGYFLLPFLCAYLLDAVEDRRPWTTSAVKLALVLFGMLLQGSLHIVVCSAWFLFVAGMSRRALRKPMSVALALAALLSAGRVLPAAMMFWTRSHTFISGYPAVFDVFESFVALRDYRYPSPMLGWWEYDMFIDAVGLAFIAYFGVYLRFRPREGASRPDFSALDVPIAVVSVLSLSHFYAILAKLPLPLVGSERVGTRFLIVPVVMLIVIAAIRMSRLGPRFATSMAQRLLVAVGLTQLVFSLLTHSLVWRLAELEKHFPPVPPDAGLRIVSRQDPQYIGIVQGAWTVSLVVMTICIGYWGWQAVRGRDRDMSPAG